MNMPNRIRLARKNAGLTQTEFGERIGVSRGAVSQWESGDVKNLRMVNLFRMEDATGFNARWLALGEGPERVKDTPVAAKSLQEFDDETKDFTLDELAALFRLAADQLSK